MTVIRDIEKGMGTKEQGLKDRANKKQNGKRAGTDPTGVRPQTNPTNPRPIYPLLHLVLC